jgi:hypothetical protein
MSLHRKTEEQLTEQLAEAKGALATFEGTARVDPRAGAGKPCAAGCAPPVTWRDR